MKKKSLHLKVIQNFFNTFSILLEGFVTYKSPLGPRAFYPGMPMVQGKDMASLVGFSRMAPLIAAWLSVGRSAKIRLINGRVLDLTALLRDGLIAGTDPQSSEYWGAIGDYQQPIVEATGIALALWLTREAIWVHMTPAQKNDVAAWLFQVNQKSA